MSLKEPTMKMFDVVAKTLQIDESTGVGTVSKETYEQTLPEGITIDTVKTLQEHNGYFIAAASKALGEAAIPVLKKNAELEKVTLSIPVGHKDQINIDFQRSRQVPDRESNGTKTKHGVLMASYDMYGSKSVGDLKKVKTELAEAALKALG